MIDDFTFTPTAKDTKIEVPFFEDARADFAPYYAAEKTIERAKDALTAEIGKLGGIVVAFQEGHFGAGKKTRYGYRIAFTYAGRPGAISVAGLPIKNDHTERKIKQVKVQALMNAADWFKAAITQRVFSPGTDILLMHLLVDGRRTVADYIREAGRLPELSDGNDIVEGEYS